MVYEQEAFERVLSVYRRMGISVTIVAGHSTNIEGVDVYFVDTSFGSTWLVWRDVIDGKLQASVWKTKRGK